MQLTEQIQLKSSPELSHLCHLAKNLYNQALFQYRQFFFNLEEFINYYDLQWWHIGNHALVVIISKKKRSPWSSVT